MKEREGEGGLEESGRRVGGDWEESGRRVGGDWEEGGRRGGEEGMEERKGDGGKKKVALL